VAYLSQAQTSDWILYYLEVMPVLAFTAAVGAARVFRRLRPGAKPTWLEPALALGLMGLVVSDVVVARRKLSGMSAEIRLFHEGVAKLPKKPNVVFVRYAPQRHMDIALVENRGMLQNAESWIVHDRGADDLRLYALARGRTAYVFDEKTGQFYEAKP